MDAPADLLSVVPQRVEEHLALPPDSPRHPWTVLTSSQVVRWFPDSTVEVTDGKLQRETRRIPATMGTMLADAFAFVERHDLRVQWVLVSPSDMAWIQASIRDFANESSVWGATIAACPDLPAGQVAVVSDTPVSELAARDVAVVVLRA